MTFLQSKGLRSSLKRSIFGSCATFLLIAAFNSAIIYSGLSDQGWLFTLSFVAGGLFNYFIYTQFVFLSGRAFVKRVFIVYWVYVPLFSLMQAEVLTIILGFISREYSSVDLGYFAGVVSTLVAVAICYPISFISMMMLSRWKARIR